MSEPAARTRHEHKHTAVKRHTLRQRAGVPYEMQRTVCARCGRVLDERPLRRTAA
jgi:NMD protein affecting ribosome stability and mRNA decay